MSQNVKNYGQSGVASSVEIGKGGARVRDNAGAIEARNNADTGLANIRAASPVGDDDVVTKRFLATRANVQVVGQIDGSNPPAVVEGQIRVCTTSGGAYVAGLLYRGESGAWVAIFADLASIPTNLVIVVAVVLTGGTVSFAADTLYTFDGDAQTWELVGTSQTLTGVNKSLRADLAHNSAASVTLGNMPANGGAFRVVVNVTQAFNGTAPSLQIGDGVSAARLMSSAEVNLKAVGTYVADCYYRYASATDILAAYSADTSTAGAATVEVLHTTA